jgi:hypothetical protein
MEGRKDRSMEGWKDGRMEGWKDKRIKDILGNRRLFLKIPNVILKFVCHKIFVWKC